MAKINIPTNIDVDNADVTAVAYVLGLSAQRVRDMCKEKILHPKTTQPKTLFNLSQAVQDYISSKEMDTSDPLKAAKIAQVQADTKFKESKAEMARIELEEFKGMMHRAEDIEAITNDLVFETRAAFLSLPSRLAVDVAALTTPQECFSRIRQECYKSLEDLANYDYDPKRYIQRVRERQHWQKLEEEEYLRQMEEFKKAKKTA